MNLRIMQEQIEWSKYFNFDYEKKIELLKSVGAKKIYAMALMPIRGPHGFRKLDYEFAEKKLEVNEIMNRLEDCHFNVFGLVIKDTDGACVWDTEIGWNPTNRDILGEFCDEGKERNIKVIASFTSMNDAYQGYLHPDRVSIHGKNVKKFGKKYKIGEISTHNEGEMRVDLPQGVSFEEYKRKIPFLTENIDEKVRKARGTRGKGYIPLTSFMCPNSKHVDYLIKLTQEVVKNYPIQGFLADYIRYDSAFTDLCTCDHCVKKFREKFGYKANIIKSKEWLIFKSDIISKYAKNLHNAIKSSNNNCFSGWFCLPGPRKMLSLKRLGQDWSKLSSILDVVSPMEYPYLMGTRGDGWFWGKVGNFFFWYFLRNMKKRACEFKSPALAVTNSVECNVKEMIKQMRGFDFGLGIALFKYFGTTEAQWRALKEYAENEIGLENLIFS